ncbi:glycoside hydrolase family 97 C-terminal domain-containing protein [Tunicatimonas pelagia]|uniref:glycoside hydrolase family 97 C-terminal domain-containing protein n=1 Tax=Tunicatimonas pelagia TaxID=931531 RepID=UPI002666A8D5|nr:glycoside hydrolase family 97 C-terminal domain-containing protein [Tunicatimonas pelagia]WKN46399.1 glycoside hydrolase family 97 C-terminal domain-containing protein [Tunicatimonas pelagia]
MPAQFDSLGVLDGKLDEHVSVVRRAGEEWFVGSLTNREVRQLAIRLDFLPPGKTYVATLYEDAEDTHYQNNKEAYRIRQNVVVTADSVLSVQLAPGGGHAIHIFPHGK